MQMQPLSLYELNHQIKQILKNATEPAYWVIGEISELKINASGHCYLELIEKNEKNDYLKARARATIWSSTFRMIRPYFESSTGTALSAGIKILIRVTVDFHEVYGLSLNIIDIEPSYTVGELAKQKQEIISRLTEDGVIDMNKELDFPRLPKHIAVISSETAAGFGDFTDQLHNNEYNFKYHVKLFPAIMQGDETENSIISALEQIHKSEKYFDVVVIIRGGGSQADLASFNNYRLALHIAQFPLPVITGIGHEQDETVLDVVSHTSLKTPTAVAEFLIARFLEEDELLEELTGEMAELFSDKIKTENDRMLKTGMQLSLSVRRILSNQDTLLENKKLNLAYGSRDAVQNGFQSFMNISKNIRLNVRTRIYQADHHLRMVRKISEQLSKSRLSYMQLNLNVLENRNQYLSPAEILKRGYSITRCNNKIVKDSLELEKGDVLETLFHRGKRKSKVID